MRQEITHGIDNTKITINIELVDTVNVIKCFSLKVSPWTASEVQLSVNNLTK